MTALRLGGGLIALLALASPLRGLVPESFPDLIREGNLLMEQERWADALIPFKEVINQHSVKHRSEKAEANYKIGVCYEKLGEEKYAVGAYTSVLATYPAEVEWASRALESRVQITAKPGETEDPIAEYRFLRKTSFILQRNVGNREVPEALKRILESVPQIAKDLGLTDDQIANVDREHGIVPK